MKNNIILIIAIVISYTTYSQECKYAKDEMRLYWSKGYSDYKIVNKDIITKQLNCLINK